jgi:hypothetical protein
VLSLPGRARLPSKPEEAAHPVAGPSRGRDEDGEVVRLHAENTCLQEENAAVISHTPNPTSHPYYHPSSCYACHTSVGLALLPLSIIQFDIWTSTTIRCTDPIPSDVSSPVRCTYPIRSDVSGPTLRSDAWIHCGLTYGSIMITIQYTISFVIPFLFI